LAENDTYTCYLVGNEGEVRVEVGRKCD